MDCKLAIKLRNLFHLSSFHFGQHHEDFDITENNQMDRIEMCLGNDSKRIVCFHGPFILSPFIPKFRRFIHSLSQFR